MIVVTGGFVSMTSETDPSTATLASGAAVGGTLGAAFSYLSDSSLTGGFSSSAPEMQVGLPSF